MSIGTLTYKCLLQAETRSHKDVACLPQVIFDRKLPYRQGAGDWQENGKCKQNNEIVREEKRKVWYNVNI